MPRAFKPLDHPLDLAIKWIKAKLRNTHHILLENLGSWKFDSDFRNLLRSYFMSMIISTLSEIRFLIIWVTGYSFALWIKENPLLSKFLFSIIPHLWLIIVLRLLFFQWITQTQVSSWTVAMTSPAAMRILSVIAVCIAVSAQAFRYSEYIYLPSPTLSALLSN